MYNTIKKFIKRSHASVLVEFAMIVPVLVVLFSGLYDVANLAFAHARVSRLAALYANTVSLNIVTKASVLGYIQNASNVALPLKFSSGGSIIISNISNLGQTTDSTKMLVNWQVQQGSGGSQIGSVGQRPTSLPGNLQLTLTEEAIVAEVYYTYTPLLPTTFMQKYYSIYKVAIYPVRGGSLASIAAS